MGATSRIDSPYVGTRIDGNVVFFRWIARLPGEVRGNISCDSAHEGMLVISEKRAGLSALPTSSLMGLLSGLFQLLVLLNSCPLRVSQAR